MPTRQTKINSDAEKKYIKNSPGLFTWYEPISVLMPRMRKKTDNAKIVAFFNQIKIFTLPLHVLNFFLNLPVGRVRETVTGAGKQCIVMI